MKLDWVRVVVVSAVGALAFTTAVLSAPYGAGPYGANIPYGDETSMSITVTGDVNLRIAPTPAGASDSADVTIVVTTTNTEGYILAVKGLDSASLNLPSGLDSIPPHTGTLSNPSPFGSGSGSTAWGLNIDGSNNYAGLSTNNDVLRSTYGINPDGETTIVKYAAHVTTEKISGSYHGTVLYTLIAPTP